MACCYNLELWHIDVEGTYLNGILDGNVYMHQPEGFIKLGEEHLICKLNKGIYGLCQSGWVWHRTLRGELWKIGLKSSDIDPTVYFHFRQIADWYVDDGLLASNTTAYMDEMIKNSRGSFDIEDLEEPNQLLGIRITRDRALGTIHISQPSFINTIAKWFNTSSSRPLTSPMDPMIDLQTSTSIKKTIDIPYASLIGSINYHAISTCSDISYATNKCTQFTFNPSIIHWETAKRIVHYLVHTCKYRITYSSHGNKVEGYAHNIAGYTKTDFARDINDQKSTSGRVFTYNSTPISWVSKKQGLVTQSSVEAELVAGSIASPKGIWLIRLRNNFQHNFTPIPLFTNNQSFISLSKNNISNLITKHIDIHTSSLHMRPDTHG